MIELLYSRRFNVELQEIALYISKMSSTAIAEKVVDSILSSVKLLQDFPYMGRLRYIDEHSKDYRLLITGHYYIYYSVDHEVVRVDGIKDCRMYSYII